MSLSGQSGAAARAVAAEAVDASRPSPWPRRLVLAASVAFGGWAFASGMGHLVAVLAARVGPAFVWDFRTYSLVLLGAAIAGPGLVAALAARGMRRGERGAWSLALAMTLVVLAVTAPALPIQPTLLPFAAVANLAVLGVGRGRVLGWGRMESEAQGLDEGR